MKLSILRNEFDMSFLKTIGNLNLVLDKKKIPPQTIWHYFFCRGTN